MKKNYTAIGGQALIEGVMMRGRNTIAIAVRRPDGEIDIKVEALKTRPWMKKIGKIPVLRGFFGLISSMAVGVRALTYSAEVFSEADESYEPSKFDRWIMDKFGDKADNIIVGISMIFAFVMAFVLFAAIPTLTARFLGGFLESTTVMTVAEGLIKIGVFIAYLSLISQMRDIKRVFQYHGAEHKSISCLESGQPLDVEHARMFTTLHPRCGTSFLFIVLVVSIIVFSFISWSNLLMRIVLKVLLLPVIAGISYEIIKWAGKSDSVLVRAVSYPGLMMQKLTTKEPDDRQLEVALAALHKVLEIEGAEANVLSS
ncbi:DUF1385 domain-containing protein [Acidaminobacter sp.]|jgi:uncharacterized protein YqhQ|uniref:DUF1385 domain-containing protein n=1 Tax=Acidaminobacter sp. TaxID=1872102 RepID=UPI00137FC03C|nr:DUF1385 domain-containing protein [Acidaminobacter sp.]MDK9711760.1 DUF1385 domain-containing protein [Acidaminobacter sp.]MZQ96463.1 DUF1385 domain-containing protein [Acidaminobacter sp.]